MVMDRLRQVSNVWNWLPAFRVVAEYESIHKAATVLNVSASALSRTVRLLEDAIGEVLFVRSATGLTLTSFGGELLNGTRDAMRRIDDVIAARGAADGRELTFVAGTHGPVLPRLLDRALASVIPEFPEVNYRTTTIEDENVAAELLRGNLDFAIVEGGTGFEPGPELASQEAAELGFAFYAPPTHPLAAGAAGGEPLADAVASSRLVMLARMDADRPGARAGRVVAVAASLESAESIAERGAFLVLLPVALAPHAFRMVAPSETRMSVLAVYRRPREQEPPPLVRALVAALGAVLRTAAANH